MFISAFRDQLNYTTLSFFITPPSSHTAMSADDFVDHAYQSFRREWKERPENQSYIAACKRQAIEGETRFQELIKSHAICKQCAGITEAVCWSTSTRMPWCVCSSTSDDEEEVALLSPPQTPIRFEDFAKLRQLRTNELLIEAGFKIEAEPEFKVFVEPQDIIEVRFGVQADLELQDPAEIGVRDKMTSKLSMISTIETCRLQRQVFSRATTNRVLMQQTGLLDPAIVTRHFSNSITKASKSY